jgi:hypothetical protein
LISFKKFSLIDASAAASSLVTLLVGLLLMSFILPCLYLPVEKLTPTEGKHNIGSSDISHRFNSFLIPLDTFPFSDLP